jgi:hypothetical protein
MKKITIGALIMMKNEKKRLHVTLESIKDTIDFLVIYDTGSTDCSIEICEDFCKKNNIPLRLKKGTFVNFEVSRNESLDWAYTFDDIDYLLLLDVNDELQNGNALIQLAKEFIDKEPTAFLLRQQWFSFALDSYYNIRFIKSRKEWYYKGVVHEYIKTNNKDYDHIFRASDDIILYQDRTQDDDKTGKRFFRDKELLLAEYKKDPTEPRTVFYLAQTCSCTGDVNDSYYYYKIRSTLEDGFFEERFHAYLKAGELSEKLLLDWSDSLGWYMKAFEFLERAEPLVRICEHYNYIKHWKLAYFFANLACQLEYPKELILFVDKLCYDYKRWHLMGIVAFYAQEYHSGKAACLKAIEYAQANPNIDGKIDESNLKFYNEKLFELQNNPQASATPINNIAPQPIDINNANVTKNQFIEMKVRELMEDNKNINMSKKQLISRANSLWKLKRLKK